MKHFILCILFFVNLKTYSQKDVSSYVKSHRISLAYGYNTDTRWWKDFFHNFPQIQAPSHTDDGWITYEYRFNKRFGIGLETTIGYFEKFQAPFALEGYSSRIDFIRLLPTMTYYFISNKTVSVYASGGVGFYSMKYRVQHFYPSNRNWMGLPFPFTDYESIADNHLMGIDWSAATGFQLTLVGPWGIYGEVGLNKSVFIAGLYFKIFAKHKK